MIQIINIYSSFEVLFTTITNRNLFYNIYIMLYTKYIAFFNNEVSVI